MTWYAVESDRGHHLDDNHHCDRCGATFLLVDRGDGIGRYVTPLGFRAPVCEGR